MIVIVILISPQFEVEMEITITIKNENHESRIPESRIPADKNCGSAKISLLLHEKDLFISIAIFPMRLRAPIRHEA